MKKGESLPEINTKTREAARAILKNTDLEDEYAALLGLPEDESELDDYEQDLAFVRDMRIDAARRLIETEDQIASAQSDEVRELKAIRREIAREINEMPAAGSTYQEWEELSEEQRSPGVGRPPLPIEVALLRSRTEREDRLRELRAVERKEGRKPFTVEQIIDTYRKATAKTGRKPIDPLGALDRQIRDLKTEIDYLATPEAEEEFQQKIEAAKHSHKGKRFGRPPEPLADKIHRLSVKRDQLIEKRAKMESGLGPVEKMERQLKLKRDDIFALRKSLRNKDIDPDSAAASNTDEGVILEKLSADVDRLKKLVEQMKSGSDDKEFLTKHQQKLYDEETKRLQKSNQELRKSARDRLGAEDINELARDLGVAS